MSLQNASQVGKIGDDQFGGIVSRVASRDEHTGDRRAVPEKIVMFLEGFWRASEASFRS